MRNKKPKNDSTRVNLADLIDVNTPERISTGITGLDKVLGGGLVPGQVILIKGDSGAGKTTLALQALYHIAKTYPTQHIATNETVEALSKTVARFGKPSKKVAKSFKIASGNTLDKLLAIEDLGSKVYIIDEFNTINDGVYKIGSATAQKMFVGAAVEATKEKNTVTILIEKPTKTGKGVAEVEHLVDTVLELTSTGKYRCLSCPLKNKYGASGVEAWFEMTDKGFVDYLGGWRQHPTNLPYQSWDNVLRAKAYRDGTRSDTRNTDFVADFEAMLCGTGNTIPDPANIEFFDFLESLWVTDEPEKVVLCQALGAHADRPGITLKTFVQRPNAPKPGKEDLVKLSNEFLMLAQCNCDALGSDQKYMVLAINTRRSDKPYATWLLDMKAPEYSSDAVESETSRQRENQVIGDVILVLKAMLAEANEHIMRMSEHQLEMYRFFYDSKDGFDSNVHE